MKTEGFFIKFIDKQYIDDMAKGNYFFKNINHFKILEEDELIGIKDPKEGTYQKDLNMHNHIIKLGYKGNQLDVPITKATLSYEYEDTNRIAIMSLLFLPLTDFVKDPINKNWLMIKPEVIKEIGEEFNGRPCLMIPGGEFMEQITEHNFEKDNVTMCKTGLINYYSKRNSEKNPNKMTKEDVFDLCFQKEEFFSKQREFRVALGLKKDGSDCKIKFKNKSKYIIKCESYKKLNDFRIQIED
ncbi:hypothetical protein [Latilactobacillus curvatus]|uniref:hypothetical protein n=1 Tax=Latilactobacillus curvatus TaxID=28038 RepID=UPI00280AC801|nr:hypothetical protein [Latilactobacillus curvatus]